MLCNIYVAQKKISKSQQICCQQYCCTKKEKGSITPEPKLVQPLFPPMVKHGSDTALPNCYIIELVQNLVRRVLPTNLLAPAVSRDQIEMDLDNQTY